MSGAPTLFAGSTKLAYDEAMQMTLVSMRAYGPQHDHWAIAFSGGKDSTATLTVIMHLLETGQLEPPKSLTVFYADTRQELPPLAIAAERLLDQVRLRGVRVEVVCAPLDKRFMVYILGRGVPPPNNNTLRWCTRQIKVDPMTDALASRIAELDGEILMITGVRQGESAIRDQRIVMSCSKDGAECGQGWYQQVLPNAKGVRGRIATLAPLLHWRVCNVWDWNRIYAPQTSYGGWASAAVADAYGGEEAEEVNARTGCTGCPLTEKDLALDTIIATDSWEYLAPLKGLKALWRELRLPEHRLRKAGAERLKDGSIAANPQRMGPLTFAAREMALDRVLSIQQACNEAARSSNRPTIDLLNREEEDRIRELIAARTWPNGWDGDEPSATDWLDTVYQDGTVQPLLLGLDR